MRFLKLVCLAITCLTTIYVVPALAQAIGLSFGGRPGFQTDVTPLKDGTYEVSVKGSSAPVAYWCGIGDYAVRTLRAPAAQRIYISKPYERGVRTVQFSMTPPEGADTSNSYSVTVKRVGANMTVSSARGHCWDNIVEFGT